MTVRFYTHSITKRAEALALVDSGATENFLNLSYARWLKLPIKRLQQSQKLYNVDSTKNKSSDLQFYTDLSVQTRNIRQTLRFFLTDLGEHKAILGYSWFATTQPKIDWKQGWIDHTQLPIILQAPNAWKAIFGLRTMNYPRTVRTEWYFIGKVTIGEALTSTPLIPSEYQRHSKIFTEEELQQLPGHSIWDHVIELLPNAPSTLPGRLLPLTQEEIRKCHKFIQEHLQRGTIVRSKSPYVANFFFVKKKDGKLRPVQDYWPLNKWTVRNRNVSPLIPQSIDRLSGCTLFTKFNVCWGYNNIRIKEEDEWKAAFLTPQGLFQPQVMFFGLTNSPATFQTMVNTMFYKDVKAGYFTIYMDDGAIHTKPLLDETHEEHLAQHQGYVHKIFDKLKKFDLYLKPIKCSFEQTKIDFLGVIMGNGQIQMDPSKIKAVQEWLTPKTPTEVRAFLGFTGYYRYFVKNYSLIARPLLDLTKKAVEWHWEEPQEQAFQELKMIMCQKPVLAQPDFNKKFYLQTDASAYGLGAVLSQDMGGTMTNESTKLKPTLHPIAYYSATFTPTEQNYDIYERELLAVMKSLSHWRPYLGWTKILFTIWTDHANLQYWKAPQNLNRRTAQWHVDLQEYNYEIEYIPGKANVTSDFLSQPPGTDQGKEDNQSIIVIPPECCRVISTQGKIQVPPILEVKQGLMNLYHDHPLAGHPGRDETLRKVQERYSWPYMRQWIEDYVKGCATCQQNKILTHKAKNPLYRIPTTPNTRPFEQIAMDLITRLPKRGDKDAILTIVDQGCSRVVVFLPCATTITGPQIAQLYLDHMYWWFGLPTKIISDWDPRFTSHFGIALMKKLGIQQNLSSTFHPQMDGLLERKNQWVEQYLWIVMSMHPEDWTAWISIASIVHNNQRNNTINLSPNQVLLGYKPTLVPSDRIVTTNETTETQIKTMIKWRQEAIQALNKAAKGLPENSTQFQIGDQVWLEATHLCLPFQTLKLNPKRYRPFQIQKVISPVAYWLDLPITWRIHNSFHMLRSKGLKDAMCVGWFGNDWDCSVGCPPEAMITWVARYRLATQYNK